MLLIVWFEVSAALPLDWSLESADNSSLTSVSMSDMVVCS